MDWEGRWVVAALEKTEEASAKARAAFTARVMESVLPLREIQEGLAPDEAVLSYVMNDQVHADEISSDSRYDHDLIKSHVVVIRRNGAALVMLPRFNLPIDSDDYYDISKSYIHNDNHNFAQHHFTQVQATASLQKAIQHQAGLNRGLRQEDVTAPTSSLLTSAHRLYRQVVEPARGELEGIRHLIVVADGDLGAVPFSLMVMTLPDADANQDFTKVEWLLKRFETSYVRSLDSLIALRREAASRPPAPRHSSASVTPCSALLPVRRQRLRPFPKLGTSCSRSPRR